jgi:hypothetical protein
LGSHGFPPLDVCSLVSQPRGSDALLQHPEWRTLMFTEREMEIVTVNLIMLAVIWYLYIPGAAS